MSASRSRRAAPAGRSSGHASTARPQLDQELIIDVGIELAHRGKAITFRSLGAELGADPTAVYRHFRNKDELVRAAFDRLVHTTVTGIDTTASWRDQLRDGARKQWEVFEAHPAIGCEAVAIVTGGPGELAAIDWILRQFRAAGLVKDDAVRFYAAYSSYLLAISASLATQQLRSTPHGAASWIGDQRAVDAARYPAVAESMSELVSLTDVEVFLMGIDVLLDAAEARASRR